MEEAGRKIRLCWGVAFVMSLMDGQLLRCIGYKMTSVLVVVNASGPAAILGIRKTELFIDLRGSDGCGTMTLAVPIWG